MEDDIRSVVWKIEVKGRSFMQFPPWSRWLCFFGGALSSLFGYLFFRVQAHFQSSTFSLNNMFYSLHLLLYSSISSPSPLQERGSYWWQVKENGSPFSHLRCPTGVSVLLTLPPPPHRADLVWSRYSSDKHSLSMRGHCAGCWHSVACNSPSPCQMVLTWCLSLPEPDRLIVSLSECSHWKYKVSWECVTGKPNQVWGWGLEGARSSLRTGV